MALFSQLSSIVLPVFICAFIGFLWTKNEQPFDTDLVSILVYKISVPCLIIATFSRVKLDPEALGTLGLASTVLLASGGLVSAVFLRLMGLRFSSYLPAMTFSLAGSMGLPVCLFAFGPEGLAQALVFFTVTSIGTFTVGAAISAGRMSLDKLIREPSIWAAALALWFLWADWTLPEWVVNTTWLLGGIAIPLQLFSLGSSLGDLRVSSLSRAIWLSIIKLSLGFFLGVGIAEIFGLTGVSRSVLILQAVMPVAVSNYMFALIYRREPAEVAGMVLISTAITAITLPALLAWLLTGN
jgi:predicted permease